MSGVMDGSPVTQAAPARRTSSPVFTAIGGEMFTCPIHHPAPPTRAVSSSASASKPACSLCPERRDHIAWLAADRFAGTGRLPAALHRGTAAEYLHSD